MSDDYPHIYFLNARIYEMMAIDLLLNSKCSQTLWNKVDMTCICKMWHSSG